MAFIKRNIILLSCALVGVLSLTALAVGVFFVDLSDGAKAAASLAGQLDNLRQRPINDVELKRAQQKAAAVAQQYERIMQIVRAKNARKPLMENIFPKPKYTSDKIEFRNQYRKALDALLTDLLKAKPEPSQPDYQWMQGLIRSEQEERLRNMRGTGTGKEPGAGSTGGSSGFTFPTFPGAGFGTGPSYGGATNQAVDLTKLTPQEQIEYVKNNAEVRMSLSRAHEIHCYASRESLDIYEDALQGQPDAEQMWDAQMSLWIQQDVLGAIGKLNADRAAALPEDQRWVAYMPVKEVVSFLVGDYVLGSAGSDGAGLRGGAEWIDAGPGIAPIPPSMGVSSVFTERASNELYDVVRFAVELVIDAREMPTVLDAIGSANFYTPLSVAYGAVPANTTFVGKIFGPGPVIQARIEWEGYFLRELYHKDLMPPELVQQIEAGQRTGGRGVTARQGLGGRPMQGGGRAPSYAPPGATGGGRGGSDEENTFRRR